MMIVQTLELLPR